MSCNNCPIWKIQKVAYSGQWARSVGCGNDVTHDAMCAMTSRTRWHHQWRHKYQIIRPEPQSDSGCHAVARGLSPKPQGRFCSFPAGKLIWLHGCRTQKLIAIGSIPMILEGFFITMATLLGFFKILFLIDVLRPIKGIPVRFRPNPLWNGGGVRWQSHKENCFYGRMYQVGPQD